MRAKLINFPVNLPLIEHEFSSVLTLLNSCTTGELKSEVFAIISLKFWGQILVHSSFGPSGWAISFLRARLEQNSPDSDFSAAQ